MDRVPPRWVRRIVIAPLVFLICLLVLVLSPVLLLAAALADLFLPGKWRTLRSGSFKQLWRRIPLQVPIEGRYWRMPPSEVPNTETDVIEWLYTWWEQIDGWVEAHRVPELEAR